VEHWKNTTLAAVIILATGCVISGTEAAEWQSHTVYQFNGDSSQIGRSATRQIVTESWNRVATVPFLTYIPEKNQLLMLLNCDYPHQAMVMSSSDAGSTWSSPTYLHQNAQGKADAGFGTGLTYLGQGKAITYAGGCRWFSSDYGSTWHDSAPIGATPDGYTWNTWNPVFAQRDASTVTRLMETGYAVVGVPGNGPGYERAYIRTSLDGGSTWTTGARVPQWDGVSEVGILQAANGNLVATCRTDISNAFPGETLDWYEGLGVSISKDNGNTWSEVKKLYDYGRHHATMVMMPNNDLLMTYVVRLGYPNTQDGYPQFGVEAVLSHDDGETWDLNHRYVIETWKGNRLRTDPTFWYAGVFGASSTLLPDGSIITAFGTGYRALGYDAFPSPRDVGLVHWRLSEVPEPTTGILIGSALIGFVGFLLGKRRNWLTQWK
jgi:hypothetical protein